MTKPIWHRPVFLTGIVSIISGFLTIPGIVADYVLKQQDIERLIIENSAFRQEQEFDVALNTLAQQGRERIFFLRYLAATHDDQEARNWAKSEVARLDQIASTEEELEQKRGEIDVLLAQLQEGTDNTAGIKEQLAVLQTELTKRDSEVAELKRRAGLSLKDGTLQSMIRIRVEKNANYTGNARVIWIMSGSFSTPCRFEHSYCEELITARAPARITIGPEFLDGEPNVSGLSLFGSLSVKQYSRSRDSSEDMTLFNPFFVGREVGYSCSHNPGQIVIFCDIQTQ